MIDIATLKIGDKVHYQPKHYGSEKWENGIVKEIPEHSLDSVRVVYNCAGDWKNYQNYTSALTCAIDLNQGWSHQTEVEKMSDGDSDHVDNHEKEYGW